MTESFIFYQSFHEALKELPIEQYGKIMYAINEYALNGTMPELAGTEKAFFLLIKPQIDANNRRKEAGNKGGRPAKNEKPMVYENTENEKPMVIETEENKKPMVFENDENEKPNVNDNVNYNSNENVNENANLNTQSADARVRKVPDFAELQKKAFNLIQEHNSTAPKERKIPISADLWQFSCREMRELVEIARKDKPETILDALVNFIKVAKAGDTWVKTFTWRSFCKNYVNYRPDYFTLSRYLDTAQETDDATKKPENAFFFKIKDNPNFHVATFEKHIADWKSEGCPEGSDYFTLQTKWEAEDVVEETKRNRGEIDVC